MGLLEKYGLKLCYRSVRFNATCWISYRVLRCIDMVSDIVSNRGIDNRYIMVVPGTICNIWYPIRYLAFLAHARTTVHPKSTPQSPTLYPTVCRLHRRVDIKSVDFQTHTFLSWDCRGVSKHQGVFGNMYVYYRQYVIFKMCKQYAAAYDICKRRSAHACVYHRWCYASRLVRLENHRSRNVPNVL